MRARASYLLGIESIIAGYINLISLLIFITAYFVNKIIFSLVLLFFKVKYYNYLKNIVFKHYVTSI